jgi:tetraacyldisaccharide 4'-kinase
LGILYGGVLRARAAMYAQGLLATRRLGRPVISVGNLAAGGSGKTPLVEFLARQAAACGLRPAVLTRGYGRRGGSEFIHVRGTAHADPSSVGDEPYWLATRNPDLPICVGANRYWAGRLAEVLGPPDLFLLDDGFQHLSLHRDLNLLLVDAARGLGNGRVLPSGWLREPAPAARRAHAVIITQANLGDPERVQADLARCADWEGPLFRFGYEAAGLMRLDGAERRPLSSLSGARAAAVSAIARPESFTAALRALGADVAERFIRPDHDPYTADTLAELVSRIESSRSDTIWVTTEKDAVKLRDWLRTPDRLWVLEMQVIPDPAWAAFFADFLHRIGLKPGKDA